MAQLKTQWVKITDVNGGCVMSIKKMFIFISAKDLINEFLNRVMGSNMLYELILLQYRQGVNNPLI
jgi:hypothetical protein